MSDSTTRYCNRYTPVTYDLCTSMQNMHCNVLASCMDPEWTDPPWLNEDTFRLLARVQNSFSIDYLMERLVSLQNQKLNMMKLDSETEEERPELLQAIKAKSQEISEARREYEHALKFKQDVFTTVYMEQDRLEMRMKQKEQRVAEAKREEMAQKAMEAMKANQKKFSSTGEEWWEGMTLIAFGEALTTVPGSKRKRENDLSGFVTDDDREDAKKCVMAVDEAQNAVVKIRVKLHDDRDDKRGREIFGNRVKHNTIQYGVPTDMSLIKIHVQNLSASTMNITPTYLAYKTGKEEIRQVQETKTLKEGEQTNMPFPLRLDIDYGEEAKGWELDIAGIGIVTVSCVPISDAARPALPAPKIRPGSRYENVMDVIDKKKQSHKLTGMIFDDLLSGPQTKHGTQAKRPATRGGQERKRTAPLPPLGPSRHHAFLQSIDKGYWCLIPKRHADGRPYTGDLPAISLLPADKELVIPYHEGVRQYYNHTEPRAVVLAGEVVDGIHYELATNVTDDNPLNGTRIESFILTTTKMAMMCLQDMPNFIKKMPGPLNFNKGHGATTFRGKEYQVLGYYAPPNKRLDYYSFHQNRTITFQTDHVKKQRLEDSDNSDKHMLDAAGPVRHGEGGRASVSYERWDNDYAAIKQGQIVVVSIKTPAMKPILAYGSNECPSCFEEKTEMLVQRPCGHKICEVCFQQWQAEKQRRGVAVTCMVCRTAVADCRKVVVEGV